MQELIASTVSKSKFNEKERIKDHEPSNFDMFFCRCLQLRGIFMYINNYSPYGYLLND